LTYALLPISLRYAVEARQYGPALAFSLCATALVVWLDQRPTWPRAALYALSLALGIYSQPYAAFIAIAHALWALRRANSARYILSACVLAALLFLPWFLYARTLWTQAVTSGGYQSSFGWKTPLMILRELTGGGYVLAAAILSLAIFGFLRAAIPASPKFLLLLCATVPLPLALVGNSLFHYFFAIRQLLFIVPPLCILAAEGLRAIPKGSPALAAALTLLTLGYDLHWFTSGAPSPCANLSSIHFSFANFVP
jgi:uncharacterized membrane protein